MDAKGVRRLAWRLGGGARFGREAGGLDGEARLRRNATTAATRDGAAFEEAFYERVRQPFEAEVAKLNFHDPGAVSVINDWVSDATNGRIEKVLDRIDPGQIMFLINALYFKGSWTREIDHQLTRRKLFTRSHLWRFARRSRCSACRNAARPPVTSREPHTLPSQVKSVT